MKAKNMNINKKVNTLKYDYGNADQEFVFCYRNRTFATLVSDNLPTPASSFIDHRLIMELGIKITDLQCKKINFGGKKLRLLGRISCTVQCVQNGSIYGDFHLKAAVIEDLNQNFDTHCIAGTATKAFLCGDTGSDPPSGATTPTRTPRTPPRPRPSPAPGTPSSTSATGTRVKFSAVQLLAGLGELSPHSHNIQQLDELFGGADTKGTVDEEKNVLDDLVEDPDEGWVDNNSSRFTFRYASGYDYSTGHGRNRCAYRNCVTNCDPNDLPHNCGWNSHWYFPPDFQACGLGCRGAFCHCLRTYDCDYHEFD